jgi:hypothetical protein
MAGATGRGLVAGRERKLRRDVCSSACNAFMLREEAPCDGSRDGRERKFWQGLSMVDRDAVAVDLNSSCVFGGASMNEGTKDWKD